jgi:hypothetical protein
MGAATGAGGGAEAAVPSRNVMGAVVLGCGAVAGLKGVFTPAPLPYAAVSAATCCPPFPAWMVCTALVIAAGVGWTLPGVEAGG